MVFWLLAHPTGAETICFKKASQLVAAAEDSTSDGASE